LFDGLYISGNKELCDEQMGKYPVISLSLKGVEKLEFASAKRMLCYEGEFLSWLTSRSTAWQQSGLAD